MRFTAATVAFFAGLAAAMPNAADTTVYETEEVTITSCGPTVTDCPASSGVVPTSAPAMTTVPSGAGAGSSPAPSGPAPSGPAASGPAPSGAPSWTTSVPAAVPTSVPGGSGPAPAPSASSYTVIAHTTCVPTVVYSTVPVPMGTSPVTGGTPPHAPSSSKPVVGPR